MALFWYIITFFVIILSLLHGFYKRRFNYWKNKGVEGPKPVPVLGNLIEIVKNKISLGVFFERIYRENLHLPFVGIYMMHRPCIVVNDLDLIKNVLIKDFAHFTDQPISFDKKRQPITDNLFTAVGVRWKSIRTKMGPAFTSNKIKHMFNIMLKCGEDLDKHLEGVSGSVDVKMMASNYAIDAIASCGFGIETECFKNPNNDFRIIGSKAANFSLKRNLTVMMILCAPDLQKIINGRFVEKDIGDYYIKIVTDTVKYREKNNIVRNDLLQQLIRLKNKQSIEDDQDSPKVLEDNEIVDVAFTHTEIAAQSFSFFLAGFDTTSTTLTLTLYELSMNQDIQQKLYEEVVQVLEDHGGKITYEGISEMAYMTQVLDETLRLHTSAPQVTRLCTKDYVMPNGVTIEKGTPVFISTQGIHMNPEYYPNPEEFNPENFSTDAKATRDPITYMAFGEGPRLCIGKRFAQAQIKIALVTILRKYKVKPPSEKMHNKIKKNVLFLSPEISLRFERRNN